MCLSAVGALSGFCLVEQPAHTMNSPGRDCAVPQFINIGPAAAEIEV